jgi:monofunctional biosynthetic peptidoglycan transglycosylase
MTDTSRPDAPRPGLRWLKTISKALWGAYQIALGALLIAIIAIFAQVWFYFHLGDIRALRTKPPETTAFIESEKLEHPDLRIRWTWVPLSSIPRPLRRMALVAEDAKFYSHDGFDWEQMEYAMVANRQRGRPFRGASTITQQTAKNLYLSGERAYTRKLREAALTLLLEHYLPKDRILEVYLNVAQFGPGVFGVAEGARYHFGKSVRNLTQEEMLSLVALLPSPDHWDPNRPSRAYLAHRRRVARNYGILRNIVADTDSAGAAALDSLNSLLTEERWGPLRSGPEPGEEEMDSSAGSDSAAAPAPEAAPAGAGEGTLPE